MRCFSGQTATAWSFRMPIPNVSELLLPCLRLLAGEVRNSRGCLPALREQFNLSDVEMAETLKSGNRTRIFDRADWAVFHLMKSGLVDRPQRGVYVASNAGREWLAAGKTLDWKTLRGIPAYRDAMARSSQSDRDLTEFQSSVMEDPIGKTPEDMIEDAVLAVEEALVDELLQRLCDMHPARFEQLIVDLLLAMGYGGGDRSMGERIGRSGDGGIDGIINEDALGLDAVYVQAKRYAPDSKVGRPALQAFVGSLTGEGANKGVFVTTSDFSREAREYLTRVQHRIVLINGARLARLMIQHEVGVRARRTFTLRSVDEDYFADPEG
jgi:restriction system protein